MMPRMLGPFYCTMMMLMQSFYVCFLAIISTVTTKFVAMFTFANSDFTCSQFLPRRQKWIFQLKTVELMSRFCDKLDWQDNQIPTAIPLGIFFSFSNFLFGEITWIDQNKESEREREVRLWLHLPLGHTEKCVIALQGKPKQRKKLDLFDRVECVAGMV